MSAQPRSIGDAVTPELERKRNQEIKELTVLKENSEMSIYSLIFSESESGTKKNEQ